MNLTKIPILLCKMFCPTAVSKLLSLAQLCLNSQTLQYMVQTCKGLKGKLHESI